METEGSISIELSVRITHTDGSGETKEVFSSDHKITKADAGRTPNEVVALSIEGGTEPDYSDAKVYINTYNKTA